jgi:hypothetical protein
MSYFNPNRRIQGLQTDVIKQYAGQTATWRQFVSASAGVSVAGFGSANSYREQLITAVFGGGVQGNMGGGTVNANFEMSRAAGNIAAGVVRVSTREPLGNNDEIVWRGIKYRVDTEAQVSTLNGYYMSILVRSDV